MMDVVGRFGGLQALQEKSSYVMMDVVGRFGGLQALQEEILVLARTGDNVASTSEKETIRERRSREPILKRQSPAALPRQGWIFRRMGYLTVNVPFMPAT